MAKKGMARPDYTHQGEKKDTPTVPLIQGKAKSGKKKANPIVTGTEGAGQKVFHR